AHSHTLSLHDALPIYPAPAWVRDGDRAEACVRPPSAGPEQRTDQGAGEQELKRRRHAASAVPAVEAVRREELPSTGTRQAQDVRSEEHTSELQSLRHL